MTYQSSLQPISCSISLSSCRLKAEAIARALNNRIWPTALINDFDEHSGNEAPQVTASSKSSHGTRSGAVIDRPPQAHDIYDSGDKVIGHCWMNGMQTDDDEEYFDTPPCSSPPSPAEDEIIVNPPTYNGISPFFSEYSYQQHEQQHSEELPSSAGYRENERIACGTKLFEKLQRYSESLSQNEDTSETFYDVSDYEDYEEQADESDRLLPCSSDVVQITTSNECSTSEMRTISSCPVEAQEEEDQNSDSPLLVTDINITVNTEKDTENCAATIDCENTENLLDLSEKANCKTNDGPDEITSAAEIDDTETHEEVSSDSDRLSRKTKFVPSDVTGENLKSYPEIGVVPPTPVPTSTSFSSNYSEDDVRDFPSDGAADSSASHLSADFRFRRIQELEEEDDRPKLLRSTSLKTGKTPPGTPGRKKIVRFADALGLDLEAVRHIVQDDLPNVPSSAYVDLKLADIDGQQPHPKATDRISFSGSVWDPGAVPGAGLGVQSLIPQFQPPSTKPDFLDKVRNQYVCLENVIVSEFTLHCTCKVLNVAFEKFVAARYTTNEWQTYEEVVASYVPSSTDGVFDKFSFSLFLRYLLPHQRLQFAIRYTVGGAEYWDNNHGENYVLRSHSNAPALSSTEDGSSWMHHFY